jgi:valyl-tRNA synthetase
LCTSTSTSKYLFYQLYTSTADIIFQKSCLCDVYIENSKAIISDGSEEEKRSATDTLYTAIEAGLTMIHPFMPFLSEELWQRLPRRSGDRTPSITVAKYPRYDQSLDDPEAAEHYDIVLGASKGIRSLMQEYRIDQAKLFIQTTDKAWYEIAANEIQAIRSLSGKGVASIQVLSPEEPTPTGCAVFVASMTAAVFLEVKGHIKDIGDEIKKAQMKMQKAAETVVKQRKVVDASDFQEKVGEGVQIEERRKLEEALAVQSNYERSIEQFQRMKLEN